MLRFFLALLCSYGGFNESNFIYLMLFLLKCRKVDPPWSTDYGMHVLDSDFNFFLIIHVP